MVLVKRFAGVLVGALALASVQGCSDSGPDGPTKEAFLAEATPICETVAANITEGAEDLDDSDPSALTDYIVFSAAELLQAITEIEAIGYPGEDSVDLEQAFNTYQNKLLGWQANPESAVTEAQDKDLLRATQVLTDYGLDDCSGATG